MKRFFAITLVLSIVLVLCPIGAFAEIHSGICDGNVTWSLDTETGTLTISGIGSMGNYSSFSDVPWSAYKDSILYVVINDGVTNITSYAFYGASNLTLIIIPDSVTSIGGYAFNGCTNLKSVYITDIESWLSIRFNEYSSHPLTNDADLYLNNAKVANLVIPVGVTSICSYAFSGCTSLTSVVIPDSVTLIGDAAFSDCINLTNVNVPDSVTNLGNWVFEDCIKLTSATIGNGVTSIKYMSFANCTSLTTVTIGNSVTTIGSMAFDGCTSLTTVTIGNSVTSIDSQAFGRCESLTNITIPDSVTSIGESAFKYCESLTSATIGNRVTSISDYTFYSCTSLTSVFIPNSVISIGSNAFYNCTSLTTVHYNGTKEDWSEMSIASGNYYLTKAYNVSQCDHIFGDVISGEGTCQVHRKCTICGTIGTTYTEDHVWNEGTVLSVGSCNKLGLVAYKCTVCGKDETISKYGDHDYKSVVTAPTCTEGGYTTHTCVTCGDSYTDSETSARGHNYDVVVTAPTCTEDGYTTYTCVTCGDSCVGDETPALGHSILNWKDNQTINDDGDYVFDNAYGFEFKLDGVDGSIRGEDTYIITNADAYYYSNPNWAISVTLKATEIAGVYEVTKVIYCPGSPAGAGINWLETDLVLVTHSAYSNPNGSNYEAKCAALALKVGDLVTYKEGVSVTVNGYVGAYDSTVCEQAKYCTRCGTEVVPAVPHDYNTVVTAPTCTEEGYTTHTCERCGDWYIDDVVEPLGHSYNPVVTAPTCTEEGYTTYVCELCGDWYVSDYVDALGHSNITRVIKPTCTEDGFDLYACKVCGITTIGNVIPALGHTEGEWETLEDGSKELHCTDCDELLDSVEAPKYAHGDINGDGKVNMFDYVSLKSHVLGKSILDADKVTRADINGDGKINMFDYVSLKAKVIKG